MGRFSSPDLQELRAEGSHLGPVFSGAFEREINAYMAYVCIFMCMYVYV